MVANARWSQKGNLLDIPTDCPTRERAGRVDAAVIVPYTLYRLYGNKEVLFAQYESMKKWPAFVQTRARRSGVLSGHRRSPHRELIVDTGYHWGEWLEPEHVMGKDVIRNTLVPDAEVATAYFAYSAGLLSEIAEILGHTDDATTYAELSRNVKEAYRDTFTKDGLVHSTRQCRYVRPVALDLLPPKDKVRNVARLNELVTNNGYKIGTGFLTTPHILPILTDYGFADTAFRVALNRQRPGWLYEVEKGATTIWENWNGIDERNVPRDHRHILEH